MEKNTQPIEDRETDIDDDINERKQPVIVTCAC